MTSGRRRAVASLVIGGLAPLLLVAGCGDKSDEDSASLIPHGDGTLSYTALGDSFTSGAGIPDIDTTNACQRSNRNYPALLAQRLGAELTDVSCGSATNDDVLSPQVGLSQQPPPQVEGVSKDTELVTVSLGLNDLRYFYDIIITCPALAESLGEAASCAEAQDGWEGGPLAGRLPKIQERLARTLTAIEDRAPDALVVVVGYPQLAPVEGTCPELPVPRADYALIHAAFEGLADAMHAAAEETGAVFVDVGAASVGHDMCADDAWVNGPVARPDAPTYHPVPEGHRAIAQLLAQTLMG